MLVLHTLPRGEQPRENVAEDEPPTKKKRKLASSTDNIPRLISVAEIVKREFVSLVASGQAGEGNPSGTLLHQYNSIGCLQGPEQGRDQILEALEGKKQ